MDANTHGIIKNVNESFIMECKLPGHKKCRLWVHATKKRPMHLIYKQCCKWIVDGFVNHENAVTHDLKRQEAETGLGKIPRS